MLPVISTKINDMNKITQLLDENNIPYGISEHNSNTILTHYSWIAAFAKAHDTSITNNNKSLIMDYLDNRKG